MRYCRLSPYIIVFLIFISQVAFAQNIDDFPAKWDPATNLSTEREKSEIYSKLRDRRCTTMTLAECNCPDAKEMKAYIDALIETGVGKEEIFYKVARKFSPNTILDKQIKAQVEERLIKEAGGKIPQIILEPASFDTSISLSINGEHSRTIDFGRISKKQGKAQRIFKLYNRGTAKLIITNIKVSCACTTVSLVVGENKSPSFGTQGSPSGWQAVIEPGASGELEVVVDLSHTSIVVGKLVRDINIMSNDILNPEYTVSIEAEIGE